MLRPTYNDLIGSLNKGAEDSAHEVESRFSVVIASAKRARQLIDGADALVPDADGKKPLSLAVDEIAKGAVRIEKCGEEEDDAPAAAKIEKEDFSRYVTEDSEEYDDLEEISSDIGSGEDNYESDSEA